MDLRNGSVLIRLGMVKIVGWYVWKEKLFHARGARMLRQMYPAQSCLTNLPAQSADRK